MTMKKLDRLIDKSDIHAVHAFFAGCFLTDHYVKAIEAIKP